MCLRELCSQLGPQVAKCLLSSTYNAQTSNAPTDLWMSVCVSPRIVDSQRSFLLDYFSLAKQRCPAACSAATGSTLRLLGLQRWSDPSDTHQRLGNVVQPRGAQRLFSIFSLVFLSYLSLLSSFFSTVLLFLRVKQLTVSLPFRIWMHFSTSSILQS